MKRNAVKVLIGIGVLSCVLVGAVLLCGVNKTVDKTLSVNVYDDPSGTYKSSSIAIKGNLKKTLSSTNFVGTLAIDWFEPSCREGVEAKITWYDGYQDIRYFNSGDFTRFNIGLFEINEKMDDVMIAFEDGGIVATEGHNIRGSEWMQYVSQNAGLAVKHS